MAYIHFTMFLQYFHALTSKKFLWVLGGLIFSLNIQAQNTSKDLFSQEIKMEGIQGEIRFPSITEDGKTLLFSSYSKGENTFYEAKLDKKGKVTAIYELNALKEIPQITSPRISYNGQRIYFSADIEGEGQGAADLYYVDKFGHRIGNPVNLGDQVNSASQELYPSISSNGKHLFFTRIDGMSDYVSFSYSIYTSSLDAEGKWSEPIKIPAPINLVSEKAPYILADNRTLIFTSLKGVGEEDYDVFSSQLKHDGSWTVPVPIDFINTTSNDKTPAIDQKNGVAYWLSQGHLMRSNIPDYLKPYRRLDMAQREDPKKGGETILDEGDDILDFDIASLEVQTTYYALLIGVNEYPDEEIKSLDKPVLDTQKLKDILVNKYAFEEENVVLLTNPVRSSIIQSLDSLVSVVGKEDNLLIFYAGHGYWDKKKQAGYWLPSDAKKANTANWFRNSTLKEYINAIPAKHTLLISDACFSGGIFKTRSAFDDAPKAIRYLHDLPSRKAMTSGALKEVPDESVFIKYLFKRLENNQEQFLSSEQLFSSFKIAVINNSTNVPQYGEIKGTGDEGGDFIFMLK